MKEKHIYNRIPFSFGFGVEKTFLIIALFIANEALSQDNWQWMTHEITGSSLQDILVNDEGTIFLHAEKEIWQSNNGQDWSFKNINHSYNNIWSFSDNTLFGTKWNGQLYRNISSDLPEKKIDISDKWNARIEDLLITDTGQGFAVGYYDVKEYLSASSYTPHYFGIIYVTNDYGETWNLIFEQENVHFNEIWEIKDGFIASNSLFNNHEGAFFKSNISGTDWQLIEQAEPYPSFLYESQLYTDTTQLAVFEISPSNSDLQKNVFHISKGEVLDTVTTLNTSIRSFLYEDQVLIVDTFDSLYISHDLGKSWVYTIPYSYQTRVEEMVIQDNLILVQTNSNELWISNDRGINFSIKNTNKINKAWDKDQRPIFEPRQIQFTSQNIGFGLSNSADFDHYKLMKTMDGGCSWQETQSIPNFVGSIKSIVFVNDSIGFLHGGANSSVPTHFYTTRDGGNTWSKASVSGYPSFINHFVFINEDVGIGMNDYDVVKTTNGGLTWREVADNWGRARQLSNLVKLDENTIYGCGYGYLLTSFDQGLSWSKKEFGENYQWNSLHFFDKDYGLMAGEGPLLQDGDRYYHEYELIKTLDAGDTWSTIMKLKNTPRKFKFFSDDFGFLICDNNEIYQTLDQGQTWQSYESPIGSLSNIFKFEDQYYFVGASGGSIAKTIDLPMAGFVLENSYCSGDTITIANNSVNSTEFRWEIEGKLISNRPDFKEVLSAGKHILNLKAGTCDMIKYDHTSDTIVINPTPTKPEFLFNNEIVSGEIESCDSTNTLKVQGNYNVYLWNDGSEKNHLELTDQNQVYLTVTNEFGCSQHSDTLSLRYLEKVEASFHSEIDHDSLIVSFVNTSLNADQFIWDFGDGMSSTEKNPTHTYNQESIDSATVKLTAYNNCYLDSTKRKAIVPLSISKADYSDISIYPNPIKRGSLLEIQTDNDSQYALFNLAGQEIIPLTKVSGPIFIEASPQLYILHILSGIRNHREVIKLRIVEK